ncbi:kinase-like protein [Amniculicola lignicola CBS 123094]|uniref:Kinase-like protein n=1 Tax=Amniculicola lignicola CBS 123094 TaxID=1392246 RepID=A0A6A5W516_9PLEO|nr:kinase-like protein [Amniculicola lignicola CBS 123094]
MTEPATLTTGAGLAAYFNSRNISASNITLLTGGTANYVYRVTLPDGSTLVYKHAAPYLQNNKNFAFDDSRMDYEAHALSILPSILSKSLPDSPVHPVRLHSYEKEAKLLCIADGGDRNLKMAYSDERLDIPALGRNIGKWIAALHTSSTTAPLSLPGDGNPTGNNPIGVSIYRYAYANLHRALSKFGHDPKLGELINEKYGSLLATENECVCHGDFWPGNVLVKSRDEQSRDVDLTIVDWEMVRRGTSATDVAQFAAEAFLLDRFRGGKGLRVTFLNAYLGARKEAGVETGEEWLKRMAVHWGVHVAFWPTGVEWADKEGTQKLVDIGVEMLKSVAEGKLEDIKALELFRGVEGI